jgi:hypothetical protein
MDFEGQNEENKKALFHMKKYELQWDPGVMPEINT